jgi:thiamine-phosphate pyrophosphorylase
MRYDLEPSMICLVTNRLRLTKPTQGEGIEPLLGLIRHAAHAGVDLIQIREPDLDDRVLEDLVCRAVALVSKTSTRIVVNDRVDVALAAGADGVHLKGTSMPAERVRELVPPRWLVGRSVHGVAEAVRVTAPLVLDYLIAGTVFETQSKLDQVPIGLDGLAAIVEAVTIPVFAIGGVTVNRARLVGKTGAAGLAAVAEFVDAGHRFDRVAEKLRQEFDTGRSSLL